MKRVKLRNTKQDLWLRDIHRRMKFIIMKCLNLWLGGIELEIY